MMTFVQAVFEQAQRDPTRPAIEDGPDICSFGELVLRVEAAAAGLQAAGVKSGDTIGLLLPDGIDGLVAALALGRLGAVVISVNETLPPADRERAVSKLSLAGLIALDESWAIGDARVLRIDEICAATSGNAGGANLLHPGPDQPFVCRQSSGTTGVPKTVVWSHAQFLEWQARIGTHVGWAPGDRYFQAVRLSFSFSRDLCLSALCLGATVILHRGTTPAALAEAICDSRATRLYVTAAHLKGLLSLERPERPLFPDLKAMFCTSMAITAEERRQARDRLTPHFHETYGTNEVGDVTVAGPRDHELRPDSIGRLVVGVEAQLRDAAGRPTPPGQTGQIGFRCPGFPVAYVNDPVATATHFHDGWYYPGDLASIDDDGYVVFKGRADDVINNAGAKFYPLEVEQVLRSHPDVEDAAVFGWPHGQLGEIPIAVLVSRRFLPSDSMRAFCLDRLASYKIPATFFRMEAFPKTGTGKVIKKDIEALLRPKLQELGL